MTRTTAHDQWFVKVHDQCVAVKTITTNLEAYDTLARHEQPGQSFSQVIKAHFGPPRTARAFRDALRATTVSEETLRAIDGVVRSRATSRARVPTL